MKLLNKIPSSIYLFWLALALILTLSLTRAFNFWELLTYDWRLQLRPTQPISDKIIIITIDDQTLTALGQWPLPRNYHASLVDVLKELGAKSVMFDVLFSEPTPEDAIFTKSIAQAQNVFLPKAYWITAQEKSPFLARQDHAVLTGLVPSLENAAKSYGHINVLADADGKTRFLPLFIQSEEKLVPQLSLQLWLNYFNLSGQTIDITPKATLIDRKLIIPTSAANTALINYPGHWENSFRQVSYLNFLKAYMELKEGLPPSFNLSQIRDAICLVGLTATGTSDLRASPIDPVYPMIGVHASFINSLFSGKFLYDAGLTVNTIINLGIFLLTFCCCLKVTPLRAMLNSFLLATIYIFSALLIFNWWGWWIDLALPLFIIIAAYTGISCYGFLEELRKRQLLEKELEIAKKIQESFLPQNPPTLPGIAVSVFFQPAKFVAGDLYDVFKLNDRQLGVFIGDVSGKGVSASLVMAQAISLFRSLSRQKLDCATVLSQLNSELAGKLGGRFITALYLIIDLDSRQVLAASAGHGPLLILRRNENKLIDVPLKGNVPLGLLTEVQYTTINFELVPGDKMIIYSDGLPEARDPAETEFSQARVEGLLRGQLTANAQATLDALKNAVLSFSPIEKQYDDLTIVVAEILKT